MAMINFGRLPQTSVNGTVIKFLYDGGELIAEYTRAAHARSRQ